jgi:predicted RNA binding protein YcfA (HicA-like mRNA interferase family)
LTAAELVRILERAGWKVARQKGSHQRLEHPDRPRTGLSREEFDALRRG